MDHDRLRHLLDHPPRDAEPPIRPALTAAVMDRLAPRPALARSSRLALVAIAGALVSVAALLSPPEALAGLGDLVPEIDAELAIEIAAASVIAALIAFRATASERIHA